MTKQQAQEDIMKALTEYDEGRITKASFSTVVESTVQSIYNQGYEDGTLDGGDDDDDDDIELDLDEDFFVDPDMLDDNDPDDFRKDT